jgi:hypothetical protein
MARNDKNTISKEEAAGGLLDPDANKDQAAANGGGSSTQKATDDGKHVDPLESDLKITGKDAGPGDPVGGGNKPVDPDAIVDGLGGTGGAPQLTGGGEAGALLTPSYVSTPRLDTGIDAPQREVGEDELASNQLNKLLAGDSKYMRQARQEGLALGGGLGGTQGIQAAYKAAIKAGAPIAIEDAMAYREAASQNLDVLSQFGLANIQRQTQLELGVMDANTRIQTTAMNNTTSMNIAKMQDITNRDIANLDAATKVKVTELNGIIQARLAENQFKYSHENQFKYSQVLNKEQHGYTKAEERLKAQLDLEGALTQDEARHAYMLEQIALTGEYDIEKQAMVNQASDEANYINAYMTAYG